MKEYASELGLKDETVLFPGLKDQDELVMEINNAGFLVLSSQYETFGSVIIEGLACGIPVVTTDVGISSSVISEKNGLIIQPGDEKSLEEAISFMLDHFPDYDRKSIRSTVEGIFNDHLISMELMNVYKEAVANRKVKTRTP
jgi:glycosyltransferase involved in cell wall biosynthesis